MLLNCAVASEVEETERAKDVLSWCLASVVEEAGEKLSEIAISEAEAEVRGGWASSTEGDGIFSDQLGVVTEMICSSHKASAKRLASLLNNKINAVSRAIPQTALV